MGKMLNRKRKARKQKRKLSKMMRSLELPKVRIPVPPVGTAFKSKKDYNRQINRKEIEKGMEDV